MNNLLQGLNVYLIGMMGSGKTTSGKYLSQKLDYRFVDTDEAIAAVAQKSIPEIFASEGESYFRELETQVLAELSTYTKCAIATGGGIIQKPINWSYLRQGLVVWLDTDRKILQKRLSGDQSRPLVSQLEDLLTIRRPLYSQADLKIAIATERKPEAIANEIVEKIPTVLRSSTQLKN
ncbi:MAG: shikimate kinase [Pleurocapsa sp.]